MATIFEKYITGEDANQLAEGSDNGVFALAQSFTIGNTGTNLTFNVSSVDVKISASGSKDLTIKIQEVLPDGTPSGTDLATATLLNANIPAIGSPAWVNIPIIGTSLKASTQFVLILDLGSLGAADTLLWRVDASSPSYGGGNLLTENSSGVWAVVSASDCMFQVNGGSYEGTLCTLADAVNKAGTNASSAGTNESLVSDFVIQAESLINSATRKNWTDAYSGLNEDIKFLLNQMTSDLAAINIITYDMAGYTSRVEAESMINVYRESFNRGLFFLLDQQVEDFMVGA
ncbi:MAG: hypothetical protein ACUZ8N_10815 [Candidatus Scalindua sp.]